MSSPITTPSKSCGSLSNQINESIIFYLTRERDTRIGCLPVWYAVRRYLLRANRELVPDRKSDRW